MQVLRRPFCSFGLCFHLQVGVAHHPERSLMEHSLWLAKIPLEVIEYGAPDSTTFAAFDAHRLLADAGSGSIGPQKHR